ncbi:MAG: hypothetical protein NC218_03440 [Acetobacter sp.]|nr:hypothetical protein [Acetobacter sp.]
MTLLIVNLICRWLLDFALWAAAIALAILGSTGWAIAFLICAICAIPTLSGT